MPLLLTSGVFDDASRESILARAMTRIAKRYKTRVVSNQVTGPHTGNLYPSRNVGQGSGFQRYHRASARGQHPSPDTFNLVNSVKDLKTGALTHRVYVDDVQAPYGKWLQDPEVLDRPIATKDDAEQFIKTAEVKNEINQVVTELTNSAGNFAGA